MKRLAVVAAVLAIAACKAKDAAPADTAVAAPAMSPAPAMMDDHDDHEDRYDDEEGHVDEDDQEAVTGLLERFSRAQPYTGCALLASVPSGSGYCDLKRLEDTHESIDALKSRSAHGFYLFRRRIT